MVFIWLAIFAVPIASIIAYYGTAYRDDRWFSAIATAFATAAIGAIVCAVCVLGLFGDLGHISKEPYEKVSEWNIMASSDGSAVAGRWGLFSGYVGTEMRYWYYHKDVNGGISSGWVPGVNTKIYEDATAETAHIAKFDAVVDCEIREFGYYCPDPPEYYEIHVPPGSVIGQHNYNLE